MVEGILQLNFLHEVLLSSFIKIFEAVTINFEHFVGGFTLNFYCTMRKNINNNEGTKPPRTKLTGHKFEARVVEKNFLTNGELLSYQHFIMKEFGLLLVDPGVLICL